MLRRITFLPRQILFFCVILCISSGCKTLDYHNIQADFNRGDYQKVDGELTGSTIHSLDPKLQFNAYTLKAYSEWQTGKLTEAKQTAATAMAQSGLVAGPRDKFMMSILPALVDADAMNNKNQKLPEPKQITMQTYKNDYENGYKQVVASLKDAYTKAPADVPQSIVNYAHCQRGHALTQWMVIIAQIWDGADSNSNQSDDLINTAQNRAKEFLQGTPITDEINKEKKFPCPEFKEVLVAKGNP